ncbi:MAG: DUF1073 domain-containing protein [Alphaproteobacteria bacterium]|nr:DUF1073 domain-containing protein [Alphaproteobacteria bacterium]
MAKKSIRMPIAINNQQKSWAASLVKDVLKETQLSGKAFDAFVNPVLSLGQGGGNALGAGYFINTVTQNFNWLKLRAMYESNWLARRLVEMQAEDMTREGIEIKNTSDPTDIQKIMTAWSELGLQKKLFETIAMARLYGGAIAVIDIDGQLLSTPLDLKTIRKGQFKGLKVLDRWQLWPSTEDYDELDNKPNYYTVLAPYDWDMKFPDPKAFAQLERYKSDVTIHRSRVIRCDGDYLPFIDFLQNQRWYGSILIGAMDVITNYLTASAALASAAYKSSFRVVKIDNMYEVLNQGTNGQAANNLMGFVQAMKLTESTENVTVLSSNDTIEILNYDLNGLLAAMGKYENQLFSLSGTPATKFLGETAKGLNATGTEETRLYYDKVKNEQENIRPDMQKLLNVVYVSTLGEQPPEDLSFDYVPLWQIDQMQKATIAKQATDSVTEAFTAGIVNKAMALKELKQSSDETGLWSNIDDEEITEAEKEDEAPPEPTTPLVAPKISANTTMPNPKPMQAKEISVAST